MRATRRGYRLLVGLALLWAVAGHIFYRLDRSHDDQAYRLLADLIEWKTELARVVPGPRLVIAGGSNAYYGLDARLMQEQLDLPVVNLALPFGAHHPLVALDLLERQVRSGDTVVFSASGFWNLKLTSKRHARQFDAYLDQAFDWYGRKFSGWSIPWRPLPESGPLLLAAASGFAPESGRSWVADTGPRGTFLACKDLPLVSPESYSRDRVEPELFDALAETAERLNGKGVKLILNVPWLLIRDNDRPRWLEFRHGLERDLDDRIAMIASEPETLLRTDPEEFCDSPLHLSTEAARERTLSLAASLRPLLGGE
jgi:hypothetical protein